MVTEIEQLQRKISELETALDSKVIAAYSEEIEKLQKISGEICSLQSSSVIATQRDKLLEALEDVTKQFRSTFDILGEKYTSIKDMMSLEIAESLIKELKP